MISGPLVHIRRSDQNDGKEFFVDTVTPNFLKEVFELDSVPTHLRSESNDRTVEVSQRDLASNDFYVVKGPGSDVEMENKQKRAKLKRKIDRSNRNDSKYKKFKDFKILITASLFISYLYFFNHKNA